MAKFLISFTLAMLLLGTSAQAQSRKELAAQNEMLAKRITVLESRLLTGDPAAERLMQRIDVLETAQRTLTGEVERLRYERDNLRSEVEALSGDVRAMQDVMNRARIHLDAVDLVASEQNRGFSNNPYTGSGAYGGTPAPAYGSGGQLSSIPQAPTFGTQTIPVQDQYSALSALPDHGKQKLAEGDFAAAQTAFKDYLSAMPDAPDAGEINYWLAETYFVRGGYADAAERYIASMRKDPQGLKAPDAMIRLAASLRELGKTREACQTLNSFPAQYPNAAMATQDKVRTEKLRTGC